MTRSKIRTSGAEGLTLSSTALTVANGLTLTDGNITVASGHGIDYAATANSSGTMSSELLDDYEEGTFTPNVADDTSGGTNASVGTVVANYIKMGNLVFVNIVLADINKSGLTSSNAVYVTGLPFTALTRSSISQHFVVRGDQLNVTSDCYGLVALTVSGGTHLQINQNRDSVTDDFLSVAAINSTSADIFISGCYISD